jgi:hypothetical protein
MSSYSIYDFVSYVDFVHKTLNHILSSVGVCAFGCSGVYVISALLTLISPGRSRQSSFCRDDLLTQLVCLPKMPGSRVHGREIGGESDSTIAYLPGDQ